MSPEADKPGVKILIVDDNPAVLGARAELFESLGCDVVKAVSADEAIAELKDTSIDVLLVDVNLEPGTRDQSGLRVAAEAARARGSDLPIVAYTAYFAEGELPMEDHPWVARWFTKGSLSLNELAEAMEGVVELGRRARSRRGE